MQNESQNNFASWRDNLEAWEGDLEVSLDKTAAWDKLHSHLQKKRSSKKVTWYWAAAACFAIALFIGNILNFDKEIPVVNKSQPPLKSLIPSQSFDSVVVISTSSETKKKKSIVPKVESKQHSTLNPSSPTPNFPMVKQDEKNETITPDSTPEMSDTITVVKVLPSKRLRVIHINELDKPIEDLNPFVQNSIIPSSQKGPFSGNTTSRITLTTNSSDNILKIKLSPSN